MRAKDFRISAVPLRIFVYVDRKGVYYRRRRGGLATAPASDQANHLEDLVDVSYEEVLEEINSRIRRPAYAFVVVLIAVVMACIVMFLSPGAMSLVFPILEGSQFVFPLFAAGVILGIGIWIA